MDRQAAGSRVQLLRRDTEAGLPFPGGPTRAERGSHPCRAWAPADDPLCPQLPFPRWSHLCGTWVPADVPLCPRLPFLGGPTCVERGSHLCGAWVPADAPLCPRLPFPGGLTCAECGSQLTLPCALGYPSWLVSPVQRVGPS